MTKSIKYIFVTLLIFTCLFSFSKNSRAGVTVDFIQCIDASFSIDDDEYELQLRGISDAIRTLVPVNGDLRLTIINFATDARVEIGPVIITSQGQADDIADDICTVDSPCTSTQLDRSGIGSFTCLSCAVCS